MFSALASAYPTAIFIVVPIDDLLAAILDAPMVAGNVENTLCIGLLRCSTGDAVGDLTGAFAVLFLYGLPFDHESLSDVGTVEVAIEFG